MSEVMDKAILTMPYDMAMADELSRRQFYDRVQSFYTEHAALLEFYRANEENDKLYDHFEVVDLSLADADEFGQILNKSLQRLENAKKRIQELKIT